MTFKRLYNKVTILYKSFFRPPNIDIGLQRRERLSIAYAISTCILFAFTSVKLFQLTGNPDAKKKTSVIPTSEMTVINLEYDIRNFTLRRKTEQTEEKYELGEKKISHDN